MEDIPVTIVGIEQKWSYQQVIFDRGGGVNIVTFSRCMLGSSPVHVMHPWPTNANFYGHNSDGQLHAVVSHLHAILLTAFMLAFDVSILLTFGIGLTRFVA